MRNDQAENDGRWARGAARRGIRLVLSVSVLGLLALVSACDPPGLQTIEVTPLSAQAAAGTALQLQATGLYSDGSRKDLTREVIWLSSNRAAATVNPVGATGGMVSSLKPGNVTIIAALQNIAGSASLTITPASLVAIQVTPADPSVAKGLTKQFTATGIFSDNSTQDLTQQLIWQSSNPAVATLSNVAGARGLASAAGVGTVRISATNGGVSGGTQLSVTNAVLSAIQVTPASPSVPKGVRRQFTATGIFSDNSTQNLTTQVLWSSSSSGVATLSNASGSQGLASAAEPGSTTISAVLSNVSGSTNLTVTAATLVSIAVTPANPSIAKGVSGQFSATGTYTDNSTQDLTTQVTWASSNPSVASVSNASGSQGLASSAGPGTTSIFATSGAVSGSTTLTVTSATLVSIAVTPANPSIANGLSEQFTATGTYTDHSTQNLTTQVTWAAGTPSVASVSNASGSQGLASSAGVGSTSISATSGAVSGSTNLTVSSATLVSIAVTPTNPSIANGLSEQFTATGTYTDNSQQNLTTQVTWSSADTSVASISNAAGSQGLASSSAVGSSTISATSGNVLGSTTLTVTTAALVSIAVTPAGSSIVSGLSEQFAATGTYTDNSTQDLTTQVTWSSSDTSVASISNATGSQGLASSAAIGDITISAVSGPVSGSTPLTVTACAVGFSSCELVTIDHTQVGTSDSNDFPMLFSGTYPFLANLANGGLVQNTLTQQGITVPADAVFASDSACTVPLNWEIESYDPTTGAVNIWVQIPALSHTSDTLIYLCVGNSSLTSFQGGAVGAAWNSNYVGVWHLANGSPVSFNDSTSNANDGTSSAGVAATTGEIGGAADLSGTVDYIATPLLLNSDTFTRILWVKPDGTQMAPLLGNDDGNYNGSSLWLNSNNVFIHNCSPPTSCDDVYASNGTLTNGVWNFVAVSVNAGTATFYINGVPSTGAGAVNSYGTDLYFASNPYPSSAGGLGGGDFSGGLDEIEISNVALSPSWITAEYNNQSSPGTFYSVQAQY